jgi:hypothetical protein
VSVAEAVLSVVSRGDMAPKKKTKGKSKASSGGGDAGDAGGEGSSVRCVR